MLLKDALKEHARVLDLLESMSEPAAKRIHADDYMVRPYLVRAHWRKRPKKRKKTVLRLTRIVGG